MESLCPLLGCSVAVAAGALLLAAYKLGLLYQLLHQVGLHHVPLLLSSFTGLEAGACSHQPGGPLPEPAVLPGVSLQQVRSSTPGGGGGLQEDQVVGGGDL